MRVEVQPLIQLGQGSSDENIDFLKLLSLRDRGENILDIQLYAAPTIQINCKKQKGRFCLAIVIFKGLRILVNRTGILWSVRD